MRRKNSSVQEWETKKLNNFDHTNGGNHSKPCRTQSTISSSKVRNGDAQSLSKIENLLT